MSENELKIISEEVSYEEDENGNRIKVIIRTDQKIRKNRKLKICHFIPFFKGLDHIPFYLFLLNIFH